MTHILDEKELLSNSYPIKSNYTNNATTLGSRDTDTLLLLERLYQEKRTPKYIHPMFSYCFPCCHCSQ